MRLVWVALSFVAAGLILPGCGGTPAAGPSDEKTPAQRQETTAFSFASQAFGANAMIPVRYTCDGNDISPALSWSGAPPETRAFAIIVDDPDAPRGEFTHWVLMNIPENSSGLPEDVPKQERREDEALQGRNDFGTIGYGGPCPPLDGPHRYRFFLYALDAPLDLEPSISKEQLQDALQGHILGQVQLVGRYKR